jgi:glycosyltransferase involved in cell wall biosynthesis
MEKAKRNTGSRSLVIITESYPYGHREVFMEKEVPELALRFESIHIFPQSANGLAGCRPLPENCYVHTTIADCFDAPKKYLFRHFFLVVRWYLVELFQSRRFTFVITHPRFLSEQMVQGINKAKLLSAKLDLLGIQNPACYSVWMDNGALVFGFLKEKKKIRTFTFRLHGTDLFDGRRVGNYMPFRIVNFKNAACVFILSKYGQEYLLNRFPRFRDKYIVNYSGLYDKGLNIAGDLSPFTIVSCSNVIPLKRVDLVAEVIGRLDFATRWYHFGDGPELEKVKQVAAGFGPHIAVCFKGAVGNDELIRFYQSEPVHLFIHLSESEGLGMAIVEAQSFGIPAVVARTEGTPETICAASGILVDVSADPAGIAEVITELKKNPGLLRDMRTAARSFFLERFEARANYDFFGNRLP